MVKRFFAIKRALLISVFLTGILLAMAPTANAAADSCRDDPILILSDGSTVHVTVDIATVARNVKTISYSVHAPAGVKLVRVVYPTFPHFLGREQFAFNDDAQPGEYRTDTVVYTRAKEVSVRATSLLSTSSKPISVIGANSQHLIATFDGLLLGNPVSP